MIQCETERLSFAPELGVKLNDSEKTRLTSLAAGKYVVTGRAGSMYV